MTAAQGQTLRAYGLGSSVGVLVRDGAAGVGGLAVAVLPAAEAGTDSVGAKYADSATSELLEAALDAGGDYGYVEAVLVGGATIVEFDDLSGTIGRKTVAAARSRLANLGVPSSERTAAATRAGSSDSTPGPVRFG